MPSPPLKSCMARERSYALGMSNSSGIQTIKRILAVLLVFGSLGVCYLAQEILIPITLALLLSLLMSPVVTWLERLGIPRTIGSLALLCSFVALCFAGLLALATPAREWVTNAPKTVQDIEIRFRSFREPMREAQEASKKLEGLAQSPDRVAVVTSQPSLLTGMASGTPRVLGDIAAVLLLIYFFLSSGNGFLRRLVEIAPGLAEKKKVVGIARDVQSEVSGYLALVSLINVALGVVTAIALLFLRIPNPFLWGAVATMLNFAPYVGPALTAAALCLVGFTTFDTLGHALAVPAVFIAIAFLEGQLITPTIVGRKLSLDPTVVFIWLLLWGWIWGIAGVLLAGPLIACLRIVCQHVDSMEALGVLISDGRATPRKIRPVASPSGSDSV